MPARHLERHRTERIGWLRAAVLGANDGILSTASLLVGVAAASTSIKEVLLAGTAGLTAGAMSMAAGEFVSVSSQSDTEQADLARERKELATDRPSEVQELADIYVKRGLEPGLAKTVAQQLMARDALAVHAREELGITELTTARPVQAALASAASFALGASAPMLVAVVVSRSLLIWAVVASSVALLAALGAIGAAAGGAPAGRAAFRVGFWGALAMALTAAVGKLFGTAVS